jgi:hypothetical protein
MGLLIGYGTRMDISDSSENQSRQTIESIRDRISAVQGKDLNEHVGEYDAIHYQLERALAAIDGL